MCSWAKTERFWIGRMRQKNVWHLKFRNSEVCIWCQVSEFNVQRLNKLKKVKRIGLNVTLRPQIATSSIAEFVVWAPESAMVQICWLRVWLLWALIRIPDAWRVLARIGRAGFSNYARIWEFVSSSVQGGSNTLLLCGLLLFWISSALGYL